jgi:hypothetical protein
MAPAHESETIVFNFRKLLSTLPNYAELHTGTIPVTLALALLIKFVCVSWIKNRFFLLFIEA